MGMWSKLVGSTPPKKEGKGAASAGRVPASRLQPPTRHQPQVGWAALITVAAPAGVWGVDRRPFALTHPPARPPACPQVSIQVQEQQRAAAAAAAVEQQRQQQAAALEQHNRRAAAEEAHRRQAAEAAAVEQQRQAVAEQQRRAARSADRLFKVRCCCRGRGARELPAAVTLPPASTHGPTSPPAPHSIPHIHGDDACTRRAPSTRPCAGS